MMIDIRDKEVPYKGEVIRFEALRGWYCPDCGESESTCAEDARSFSAKIEKTRKEIDAGQARE